MAENRLPTSLSRSTKSTYVETLRSVTVIDYTSQSVTRTVWISRTTWDVILVTPSSSERPEFPNPPTPVFPSTASTSQSSEPTTLDSTSSLETTSFSSSETTSFSSSETTSSSILSLTTEPTTSSVIETAPSSSSGLDEPSSSSGHPPTGTIVTASVCSAAGLALAALLIWILRRRRQQRRFGGSSESPQMEIAEKRPPEPTNPGIIMDEYGPRISTAYSSPPSSPRSPLRVVSDLPPSLPLDFERGVSVPSMRRPVSELETTPVVQRGISAPSMRRPISELGDTSVLSQLNTESRSMMGPEGPSTVAAHVSSPEFTVELEDTSIKSEVGDSRRATLSSLEGYTPSAIGIRPSSSIRREPTVIEETEDSHESFPRTIQTNQSAGEYGQTTQVFVTPQGSPQRVQKRNPRMGSPKRQPNQSSYSGSVAR